MGAEAECVAAWNGKRFEGKALLETDHVLFRGETRVKLLFSDIKRASVDAGTLRLAAKDGMLELELGEKAAAKWLDKILHPPSLLDKLGVKSGMRVCALAVTDETFLADLKTREADVSTRSRKDCDLVFLQVDKPAGLDRIEAAAACIKPDGGVWVVTPRGVPELKDTAVMAAAHAAGLVDVKVARFSDTHTALKFVVPKAKR